MRQPLLAKVLRAMGLGWALVGAGSCDGGDHEHNSSTLTTAMQGFMRTHVGRLDTALGELAMAAPRGHAWLQESDKAALLAMRAAWKSAHAEALAVGVPLEYIFPAQAQHLDRSWEREALTLMGMPDPNPFDDQGVVGLHAIERVLWGPESSGEVLAFERKDAAYFPALAPATAADADDFANLLVGKVRAHAAAWLKVSPALGYDQGFVVKSITDEVAGAFRTVITAASPGESESRYSRSTALALGQQISAVGDLWTLLRPTLPKTSKATDIAAVDMAYARLVALRPAPGADELPLAPPTWNPFHATPEDLASPYGKLYVAMEREALGIDPGSFLQALKSAVGDEAEPPAKR